MYVCIVYLGLDIGGIGLMNHANRLTEYFSPTPTHTSASTEGVGFREDLNLKFLYDAMWFSSDPTYSCFTGYCHERFTEAAVVWNPRLDEQCVAEQGEHWLNCFHAIDGGFQYVTKQHSFIIHNHFDNYELKEANIWNDNSTKEGISIQP